MTPNIAPAEIWAEYEQGKSYNQLSDVDLYNTVRQNENFYIGKQWEGVRAPDLDKPVLNILKRVVSYFISTLVSDDVTAQVDYFESAATDDQNEMVLTVINQQFDEIIEMAKVKAKNREAIRDAAVDGDACFYVNYDPDIDNGQLVSGAIEVETVYNTNVIFGNPCTPDVQKQPYIIIVMRRQVKSVRAEAMANGMSEENAKKIISDADSPDDQHKADRKTDDLHRHGRQFHLDADAGKENGRYRPYSAILR